MEMCYFTGFLLHHTFLQHIKAIQQFGITTLSSQILNSRLQCPEFSIGADLPNFYQNHPIVDYNIAHEFRNFPNTINNTTHLTNRILSASIHMRNKQIYKKKKSITRTFAKLSSTLARQNII